MNLQIRIPSEHEIVRINWRQQHKQWFRTLIQASEYVVHLLQVGMSRPMVTRTWALQTLKVLHHYEELTKRLCGRLHARRSEWCAEMIRMDERLFQWVTKIRQYGPSIDRWIILPHQTTDDFHIQYSFRW